jgi:hypothetical protein
MTTAENIFENSAAQSESAQNGFASSVTQNESGTQICVCVGVKTYVLS